jgi:CDP-paratose 2-epimerase
MQTYLITGGAGFIGTNAAAYHLKRGRRVIVFDNLSRPGTERNIRFLQRAFGSQLVFLHEDIRRTDGPLLEAVQESDAVLHLCGQVAVTTSVTEPREDFEINALGTLNVLEAVRASRSRPPVIYSSTNKVYGKMDAVAVRARGRRYEYVDLPQGIGEDTPLDFHSPYGCSKGCADQYVRDYSRIYGLKTVVFRQSCIYGPHQMGIEDQGWVAWFTLRAMEGRPVAIYGDGMQVRDVLYVEDLIAAYCAAIERIDEVSGQTYNIGGGPDNTLSLLELIDKLEARIGHGVEHRFEPWRPGDQLVYVSDIRRAQKQLNWTPRTVADDGISRLAGWIEESGILKSAPAKVVHA